MTKKLTGLHPLAYMGVNSEKPPNLSTHDRDPLTTDYQGFAIGSLWVRPVVNRIYMLTDKTAGIATWLELSTSSGGDDVESLIADDGLHAQPNVAGDITIVGGTNVTTSANIPNQLRVDLDNDVTLTGFLMAADDITTGSNFELPASNDALTEGVITADGKRFIHNYSPLNKSAYVGIEAGNIDPLATGESNTGMGYRSLKYHTTGGTNTAYGANSLRRLVTGTDNIALGNESGVNYLGTEASNIVIGSRGTAADANKIRIGTDGSGVGEQDSCSIAGIYGVTPAGAANQSVIVNADGELGSEAGSAGNAVPVGSIVRYDQTLPVGTSWLACDGSAVSQATYAALFGVIGHDYCYPTVTLQPDPFAIGNMAAAAHNGLAGVDGLWVAVSSQNEISTSTDGLAWAPRVSPFAGIDALRGVSHNHLVGVDGLWMITRNSFGNDSVATSPDGITWTAQTTVWPETVLGPVAHNGLTGVDGLWMVTISLNGSYYSNDTITWTRANYAMAGLIIYDILFFPPELTWHACGSASYCIGEVLSYKDTINYWVDTFLSSPYSPAGANGEIMRSMALFKSVLYVATQGKVYSTILKSKNGLGFTAASPIPSCGIAGNFYPSSIRSSNSSLLVSYAYDGRLYTSNDGNIFTEILTPFSKYTAGTYGEAVTIYNSNGLDAPDDVWLLTGSSSGHAVGAPAINTATEFYLPNIEDQIILF